MNYLDILSASEREYAHNSSRRKSIVKNLLKLHLIFKKSDYAILSTWCDREVDFLHLGIMYVDMYLASDKQSQDDDITVAAGCYSIAYKYEIDRYETKFIDFLMDISIGDRCGLPTKNLHKKVVAFEWILLPILDWRVSIVTPVTFIREYANLLGIESCEACLFSLKLIILDICQLPSNWGIRSLILTNSKAKEYFQPSDEDLADLAEVNISLKDDWRAFKKENPDLRYIVKKCGTIKNL